MSVFHPKKTLVPLDFSEQSLSALDQAVEIAGEEGTVEVIHVLEPLMAMEPGNLYGTINDEMRITNAEETIRQRLAERNHDKIPVKVSVGNPGTKIAEYGQANHFDLIVIPSHGYGGVKRLLLGSVADRVVRLSSCPVLVLRE